MMIGYARTSTTEQEAGFAAQIRDLKAAGAERIHSEQVSSVAQREKLERALEDLRRGDVLVVTKLDRLARSVRDLMAIVDRVTAAKASLRILAMDFDTTTPTGRLLLGMLGSVAEFERAILLERQREGIAKARLDGKYKGRKPTARTKAAEVRRLHGDGVSPTEIANRLGIGRASVYRALNPT